MEPCCSVQPMDAECGLTVLPVRQGFVEGDEVVHDHFGSGIIKNVYDGGDYCEVEFWGSGTRMLKAEKLRRC